MKDAETDPPKAASQTHWWRRLRKFVLRPLLLLAILATLVTSWKTTLKPLPPENQRTYQSLLEWSARSLIQKPVVSNDRANELRQIEYGARQSGCSSYCGGPVGCVHAPEIQVIFVSMCHITARLFFDQIPRVRQPQRRKNAIPDLQCMTALRGSVQNRPGQSISGAAVREPFARFKGRRPMVCIFKLAQGRPVRARPQKAALQRGLITNSE